MTVRRLLPVVTLAAVVLAALVIGSVPGDGDPSPAARTRRLAAELRCPVCQGLSVADSPSPTARAISADIRRRVDAGQSDGEIRQAYVDRYGEWVLLEPAGSGLGALVWALPVAGLLVAAGGLALAFRRWRRDGAGAPSDADRELVQRALAEREVAEPA
ncbi:MAG: cytochrome c-type biogenesis protein CcmH [Actinomycetota bacterium]|nr:cytochrome c-type biogenesis protein CcmH [Actinomycetota bacterium]